MEKELTYMKIQRASKHKWTKEDTEFVLANYASLGPTRCGEILGLKPQIVKGLARRSNIKCHSLS